MKIKLRAWREDDASRLYDIYRATPDLVHQMPALGSVEDARTLICEELLPSSEHIPWCLEADNQAAGCVGFRCMGRQPSGTWDRAWVYYWISAETRGLGITRRCVRAACDWAQNIDASNDSAVSPGKPAEQAKISYDFSALTSARSPRVRRLELGYRTNNPASAAVARHIGFVVEGVEREKFCYNGVLYDAAIAARLHRDVNHMLAAPHRLECRQPCKDSESSSFGRA